MSIRGGDSQAGGFAADRFRERRRRWRRRIWWTFPLLAIIPLAAEWVIAVALGSRLSGLLLGLGLGAGIGCAYAVYELPPGRIENWRTGAEGERSTARALRPLLRQGWTAFHDIPTGHGNIDHILVGPPGVFLLETKRLSGELRVQRGVLHVRLHEDPDDGYDNVRIAPRARAMAADLRERLAAYGATTWVQPLVVLWGDFPQGSVLSDGVAWVSGPRLAEVLVRRPVSHSFETVEALTTSSERAVTELRSS